MASVSSSLSVCLPCQALALARSNSKPRKQLTSKNPNNRKPNNITTSPAPPLSSVSGGQATTYTRLPPKDDDYLFLSQSESPTEIQLSDIITTPTYKHNKSSCSSKDKIETDEESSSNEDEELGGFDYGKFELLEINAGTDTEAEECDELGLGFENKEEEEEREKEKGVPAVMRCFDRAKIYVRSGDGGNGVMAFRREKFVPLGGPSGGDGGRGGNVYMEVDTAMNSLLPFRNSVHFRAGRGSHGQGSKMNGAKGEDVVVKVPPGTVVRVAGKDGVQGDVLLELLHPGDRALLLPGGRGGRGNASFKSGNNKVPRIAENGEEGPEMKVLPNLLPFILSFSVLISLQLE